MPIFPHLGHSVFASMRSVWTWCLSTVCTIESFCRSAEGKSDGFVLVVTVLQGWSAPVRNRVFISLRWTNPGRTSVFRSAAVAMQNVLLAAFRRRQEVATVCAEDQRTNCGHGAVVVDAVVAVVAVAAVTCTGCAPRKSLLESRPEHRMDFFGAAHVKILVEPAPRDSGSHPRQQSTSHAPGTVQGWVETENGLPLAGCLALAQGCCGSFLGMNLDNPFGHLNDRRNRDGHQRPPCARRRKRTQGHVRHAELPHGKFPAGSLLLPLGAEERTEAQRFDVC